MSILNTGASVLGGLLGAFSTGRNIKKQAQYNRELADRQYGHQLDMWNKMNAYNAPTKQMERFKDAGLNPHLIYGQGNAGNASTLPQYQEQAPDFSSRRLPDPSGMIATYNQLQLAKENALIARAQRDIQTHPEYIMAHQSAQVYRSSLDAYSAENVRQKNMTEMARRQYELKNSEAQYQLTNTRITAQELQNAWARLQEQYFRRTKGKLRTEEQAMLIEGWSDILQGNYSTNGAQNIMLTLGTEAYSTLKTFVPAKMIQQVLKGAGKGKTQVPAKISNKEWMDRFERR